MSDLLATLLSSLGEGAKTLGAGMSEKAMANNQERMKTKRQLLKDAQDYEQERQFVKANMPHLLPSYDRSTEGVMRPLGDSRIGKLQEFNDANEAKKKLDAMNEQVPQQYQQSMGDFARQSGMDSPLGVTPQTSAQQFSLGEDFGSFAKPAYEQAIQRGVPAQEQPTAESGGGFFSGMSSKQYSPSIALGPLVDSIYMGMKTRALDNRQALTDKSAIESKKRMRDAGFGQKEDAGSTLTDNELWTQFNSELNRMQSQYETDSNFYRSEMRQYEEEKSRLEQSNKSSDKTKLRGLRPPNPPLYPPTLSNYKADGESAFRLWANKKRGEFGGVNKPIEIGGKRKLTPEEAKKMLIARGRQIE
jgi:hypothetical protein